MATNKGVSAKKGIKWDEQNLIETSLERGTRQKIDEPKTPYIHGIAVDPDDMESGEHRSAWKSQDLPTSEARNVFNQQGAEQVRNQLENYQLKQEETFALDAAGPVTSPPQQDPDEWLTSASEMSAGEHEDDAEGKHDGFAKKRQQHYKMKEALMLGKKLLSSDTGEDDDEDADDIDTKSHRDNQKSIDDDDDDMSLEDYGQVTGNDTGYMEEDDDSTKVTSKHIKHKKKLKHALKIKVHHSPHQKNQTSFAPPLPKPKQVQQAVSQNAYCSSADADDERSPWPQNSSSTATVTSNTD